jgi:hypothetical protein
MSIISLQFYAIRLYICLLAKANMLAKFIRIVIMLSGVQNLTPHKVLKPAEVELVHSSSRTRSKTSNLVQKNELAKTG